MQVTYCENCYNPIEKPIIVDGSQTGVCKPCFDYCASEGLIYIRTISSLKDSKAYGVWTWVKTERLLVYVD